MMLLRIEDNLSAIDDLSSKEGAHLHQLQILPPSLLLGNWITNFHVKVADAKKLLTDTQVVN